MRRRLTVTGSSGNAEHVDGHHEKEEEEPRQEDVGRRSSRNQKYQAAVRCAVTEYSGVSKKGHAPYNPRKKNQDALVMADDPGTNSLILGVLDGHGEHGDYVSAWFRDQLI